MNELTAKNVLLLEPGYPNKYPPLGLMKIAEYHGPRGRGDNVVFAKGEPPGLFGQAWDRVYVTTLFSFEWKRTAQAIDAAVRAARGPHKVFVGGIAASLMREEFEAEPRWKGVRFIQGLLDQQPPISLRLGDSPEDFGAGDGSVTPIEDLTPDYSILEQTAYRYPVEDAYFGYASRGCVRKCSFCGVPALEGPLRETPPLFNLVDGVSRRHGEKKDLVLMDNNIAASARFQEIIAEIRDLGFSREATIKRDGRRPVRRRVDFNQGLDARILSKSPMFLRELATTCISPLRIAFDHTGVTKPYEKAVRMAAGNGMNSLSNYMLYNFMDNPEDLYERMSLNIRLNQELGLRIWSFPMRYQPVKLKDRSHVGPRWTRYQLRSFQIMLQATRGIVSGSPEFFRFAYGKSPQEFRQLLSLPHAFIFYREHFNTGAGRGEREEYERVLNQMSESQRQEIEQILSEPLEQAKPDDRLIKEALRFHRIPTTTDPRPDGPEHSRLPGLEASMPPPEETVEDAGLDPGPDIRE